MNLSNDPNAVTEGLYPMNIVQSTWPESPYYTSFYFEVFAHFFKKWVEQVLAGRIPTESLPAADKNE